MIKYPSDIDDDSSIPVINDNINEIGAEVANASREAIITLEMQVGIGAPGTKASLAERLGVSIQSDGYIKPSALTSLGLVTLPITNSQIANNAGIPESKLHLDYRTGDLFNYIRDLAREINLDSGWITDSGMKLEPHIAGFAFFHSLRHIVVGSPSEYLKNKFNLLRDNTDSYTLVKDINAELVAHQLADGSPFGTIKNVTTNNGSTYPSNYAHTASGVFLNTSRFITIPQTLNDVQLFADFIDNSSIFLLGSRIQNLYSDGISRVSRSSSFTHDGYGQALCQTVPATTYLLTTGISSSPVDDFNNGDDIIELHPPAGLVSSSVFDAQFALVKIGDIIRVNYGTVEVPFLIKEKKYVPNSKYIVRINGKNLQYTTTATARIDRSLVDSNKYGVLALSAVNNPFNETPSLIVGAPRGAEVLGLGFNADLLDTSHYNLYLALYPTGNPSDGYTILPGIDVTGNKGATPGKYTIDSIVEATNAAFRQVGYNYRFLAFSYQGNFGIKLADSYNNAAFSILSAVVIPATGGYDQTETGVQFPKNVIDVFATTLTFAPDALGFGPAASNLASPPYMTSYGSAAAAVQPTKLFVALKRKNYYVNGLEKDQLAYDIGQVIDGYGDVYWQANVKAINPVAAPFPAGHVEVTYTLPLNLENSGLKAGKTLVVQTQNGSGTLVDFGRFIIKSVSFINCAPDFATEVTVYDAVHAKGTSPAPVLAIGSKVAIYFDSSSVSLNIENASDISASSVTFKRHHEIYITQEGQTFTHERARANIGTSPNTVNGVPLYSYSELAKFNIVKVSPKLRGYQFGSVTKITLHIIDYNDSTGIYSGYLGQFNGTTYLTNGNTVIGRKGEVTRFYDPTNVDYIDFTLDVNDAVSSFSNKDIDIQLFPTLSLDDEVMLLGTFQYNDVSKQIAYLRDARQFGNTSEKDLSTSVLNLIALPEKLLHSNGIVRGFDIAQELAGIPSNEVHIMGGHVLVDGKLIQMNDAKLYVPAIKEFYSAAYYNIKWALCVNSKGEYQFQPLLDHDVFLGTPNNPTRVIQAFNPNNGSYYYIDANTFSDIVNNRKDLTILYLISATVTASPLPATISLFMTDARKFINDADGNFPLKLTSGAAQGNFKSPISIINWITYNNAFNSTANVNGATNTSGYISIPVSLDFGHSTVIDGENNAQLTFASAVQLGSNITFRNLRIDFTGVLTVMAGASNVIFDHCEIHINPSTITTSGVLMDFAGGSNVTFKDCDIFAQFPSSPQGVAVFRVDNTANFKFDGNTVDATFVPIAGQVAPGAIFIFRTTDGVVVEDSVFTGNFAEFVVHTASNNLTIRNVDVTSIWDPSVGPDHYVADPANGMPIDFIFNTTDIVNSGRGFIYSSIDGLQENFIIENSRFTYAPVVASSYRLSFINFELARHDSVLNNLKIKNCKFTNANLGTIDDIAPAIAIINKSPVAPTTQSQPIVSNLEISYNNCNKNQMILLTSVTDVNGYMNYPGLVAQGANIHDNICGTIGYFTSGETKFINISPNLNSFTDKMSGLTIENNICHYVSNLDSTGQHFYLTKLIAPFSGPPRTVNLCNYATGYVTVRNNKANWIHVGNTPHDNSFMQVSNNSLCAYDQSYIALYGDQNGGKAFYGSYGFAISVGSNIHQPAALSTDTDTPDGNCQIFGNTVNPGNWLQTNGTLLNYKYPNGYIWSQGSSFITQNTLRGIEENLVTPGVSTSVGVLVSGVNNIITNNRIYRNGMSILAYVAMSSYDTPTWDGYTSRGLVTDNYFDSPWITDYIHNDFSEIVVNTKFLGTVNADRWVVERNINQTGWKSIPLSNSQLFGTTGIATTSGTPGVDFFVTVAPGRDAVGSNVVGLYKSNVLWIHDNLTPAARLFGWQENIDKHIPHNVRIIKVEMGVRPFGTIVDAPTSQIYLSLNKYTNAVDYVNLDYFTAPATGLPPYGVGIKDSKILNDSTPVASLITGPVINSTTLTIPAILDTTTAGPGASDVSDQFVTGNSLTQISQGFSVTLDVQYTRTAGFPLDIYFSPILVKYRW